MLFDCPCSANSAGAAGGFVVARVNVNLEHLDRALRPEMTMRARHALEIYRRAPLRLDAPDYPFARRAEDGSIRDPRSSSIRPIPGGVRIKVQSRGAPFIEEGNDASGRYIRGGRKGLALPLRTIRRARGRAHAGKGGRVVIGANGKPYLMVQRVRTYRGRRLLERSVSMAFTGRSGMDGGRGRLP